MFDNLKDVFVKCVGVFLLITNFHADFLLPSSRAPQLFEVGFLSFIFYLECLNNVVLVVVARAQQRRYLLKILISTTQQIWRLTEEHGCSSGVNTGQKGLCTITRISFQIYIFFP